MADAVVYTFSGWYCLCVVKIDVERMTVIEDPTIDEEDTQVWFLEKSKLYYATLLPV